MSALPPLTIVGAGGHAKVVVGAARAAGYRIEQILDDDSAKHGQHVLGVEVTGPVADILPQISHGVVLGIGANKTRDAIARRFDVDYRALVHPLALVHESVVVEQGAVVFAGAVIQPDSVIGCHAIVNTSASIDHDCSIGAFAHIAPGVCLAGGVLVGEGAFLGIGSCAIPGVKVGSWTTVGAGAAVVSDLPAGVVAVGVPARVLERKTDR